MPKCIIRTTDIRKSVNKEALIRARLKAAGFDMTRPWKMANVEKKGITVFEQGRVTT